MTARHPIAEWGCYAGGARASLQAAQQNQDNEDYQHQTQAAAGIVAPAGAVRPGRQRADQQQNDDDQENGSQHGSSRLSLEKTASSELAGLGDLAGAVTAGA